MVSLPTNLPYGGRIYSDILAEGLKYVDDRRKGRIQSFKLPWEDLNKLGVGGLEWGSMLTIGARPGSGKTMVTTQILREAAAHNPGYKFNILEFQFEMGAKQQAARAFTANTALDYNVILSTDRELEDYQFQRLQEYVENAKIMEKLGMHRVVIGNPLTCKEIEKAVHDYFKLLGGLPMIITIDHSWLVKKGANEKEKLDTLYNTAEMIMQLKNTLPVIVIMITQLSRGIDTADRKQPGNIGNYPTSSDIFGGELSNCHH